MMVMKPNSVGGTSPSGGPSTSSTSNSNAHAHSGGMNNFTMSLTRKPKALRRNRSKGTIAGFASPTSDSAASKGMASPGRNGDVGVFGAVTTSASDGASGTVDKQGNNQPQHAAEAGGSLTSSSNPVPPKPTASARLALVCVQNAIYMGAKTRIALCPPGRARRDLLGALQTRRRRKGGLSSNSNNAIGGINGAGGAHRPTLSRGTGGSGRGVLDRDDSIGFNFDRVVGEVGIKEYDRAEEEFLSVIGPEIIERETNSDGEEILEDPSSGDEDDLDPVLDDCDDAVTPPLGGPPPPPPGSEAEKEGNTYAHREPLYTPVGTDQASVSQGGTIGVGSAASGKLPFNRRKVRWFDNITASDLASARQYLRQELTNLKRRDGMMLTKHLRKMQRRERRRIQLERSRLTASDGSANPQDLNSDDEETEEITLEMATLAAGATRLPSNMSSGLAAALILESLSINPRESLEGLAKCYDGIVSAGAALLDSEIEDPTIGTTGEGTNSDKKPSRSGIMNALAPILITTLEHPSGDAILALSKLRSMCGTKRYQRRFVQRVAPCLIRPPNAAMWSLRHKNDMEPILAAVEMILDAAPDVFASGWYDRGQTLLADSQRAETLRSAAIQLKRLSSANFSDGLSIGLNAPGSTSHGHRRSGSLMIGSTPTKDGTSAGSKSNEPLAEWEVFAVDRQIRKSITNLFTNDWSRVTLSSLPSREGESSGSRHRRGISSAKVKVLSAETIDMLSPSNAAVASAAIASLAAAASVQQQQSPANNTQTPSPLSPRGPLKMPLPTSPHSSQIMASSTSNIQPTSDTLESVFGPSFATQDAVPTTSTNGNTETSVLPIGPPSPPKRSPRTMLSPKSDVGSDKGKGTINISGGALTPPQTPTPKENNSAYIVGTPPRSPSSPPRANAAVPTPLSPTTSRPLNAPTSESYVLAVPDIPSASPGREDVSTTPRATLPQPPHSPAPLSPTSSIGNSSFVSTDSTSNRISTISVGSGASAQQSAHTAYLQTLTSTAAERKRTVAACRALRAQISRFEEAFVQLHGRTPKGAAERAPLATTYAQYREWKRAIRADAACRIQALFRGARVRWLLLASDNPRMKRLVMTRAGRADYGSALNLKSMGSSAEDETMLRQLSIPVDIGGDPKSSSPDSSSPGVISPGAHMHGSMMQQGTDEGSEVSNIGVEVIISPTNQGGTPASTPSLSPSWGSVPRGGRGRGVISDDPMPVPRHSPDNRLLTSGSSSPGELHSGHNMNEFSLADLQAKKRELKQQLKQYDMNFARQHGRMPVKAEKEPIRHLYESYNALKSRIIGLERDAPQKQGAPVPYRRHAGSIIGVTDNNSSSDEHPSNSGAPPSARSKRKEKAAKMAQQQSTAHSKTGESGTSTTGTPSGAPSTDLAALKAEKGTLHQMLRSYEKDFFRMHNRQVSSFADIRPVANQYKRYKEIKKAIAALQQQQSSGE